jgi:protein-tyrosine kinase
LSFIDKALERAKILNKEKGKTETPLSQPQPSAMPDSAAPGLAEGQIIPEDIRYTITRTVPVDLEILRRNRILAGKEAGESLAAEGYRLLRTHLLHQTTKEGRNTLMVTGPQSGEGKTLTAINLAISISKEINHTVLLVDTDLRSPSITDYFGLPKQPGLVDYLIDEVPIPELLIHPQGLTKLVILPAGRAITHAAELLNSPRMRDLVQELKHFYTNRYVIFDLPPLLTCADALTFAPLMDGIMVIIEAGRTAKEDIKHCQEMLKQFRFLGFVLNKTEETLSQGYYYPYPPRIQPTTRRKFKLPLFK